MLYINNVLMPDPKQGGVKIKKEKVWSENTQRTASGRMVGDIVCIKRTLTIEWPPLTNEQVRRIDNEISNINKAFVQVKYTDEAGAVNTMWAYFGTPAYTLYSWANGIRYVSGVAVDAIEQ